MQGTTPQVRAAVSHMVIQIEANTEILDTLHRASTLADTRIPYPTKSPDPPHLLNHYQVADLVTIW